MRISGKNALLYLPARETVLGLVIPVEPIEITLGDIEISYTSAQDRLDDLLAGLPDASGEFTGYFEKDGCDHGEDSPSPSGS